MRPLSTDEAQILEDLARGLEFEYDDDDPGGAAWTDLHEGLVARGCLRKHVEEVYEADVVFDVTIYDITDLGRLAERVSRPLQSLV